MNAKTKVEPLNRHASDQNKMAKHVGKIFLPGDKLDNFNDLERTSKAVLGPGLRQEDDSVHVSKPGILRHKEPNIYWIDSHQKRVIIDSYPFVSYPLP